MATWRYLTDDGASAAAGLALDEALMDAVATGADPARPTLRLYSYGDHAALIGRYQTLAAELDLGACAATGTGVSRRPTGGGAIIMGRDQLGVALVLPAPDAVAPRALIPELGEGVIAGLRRLGITAEFGGKNDVLVAGRKIAGLGVYLDGRGGLLFHSSVLADLDIDFMLQVLNIPAAKLAGKAVAAVQERITTVHRELGRGLEPEELRGAVAEGFAERFGVGLVPGEPAEAERTAAAGLVTARYANPSWLHEPGAQPDGTGSAVFRSPEGLVRAFVAVQGSLVKSVLFTGDFNTVPGGLRRLEAALRWRRLDPPTLRSLVSQTRLQSAGDVGWRDDEDVVSALLGAGAEALKRAELDQADAAPVRAQGSCYFPDQQRSPA